MVPPSDPTNVDWMIWAICQHFWNQREQRTGPHLISLASDCFGTICTITNPFFELHLRFRILFSEFLHLIFAHVSIVFEHTTVPFDILKYTIQDGRIKVRDLTTRNHVMSWSLADPDGIIDRSLSAGSTASFSLTLQRSNNAAQGEFCCLLLPLPRS